MSKRAVWARTYKIPVALTLAFLALLVVLAITPDPDAASSSGARSTARPTSGPAECSVCGVDETCDPGSGQCIFVDHTPLPCVPSAKFNEGAEQCLPEGAPPAPSVAQEPGGFPGGIGGRTRIPRLPGLGN